MPRMGLGVGEPQHQPELEQLRVDRTQLGRIKNDDQNSAVEQAGFGVSSRQLAALG
jgi:hypothetical protein